MHPDLYNPNFGCLKEVHFGGLTIYSLTTPPGQSCTSNPCPIRLNQEALGMGSLVVFSRFGDVSTEIKCVYKEPLNKKKFDQELWVKEAEFREKEYTPAVDTWSFGLIVYESASAGVSRVKGGCTYDSLSSMKRYRGNACCEQHLNSHRDEDPTKYFYAFDPNVRYIKSEATSPSSRVPSTTASLQSVRYFFGDRIFWWKLAARSWLRQILFRRYRKRTIQIRELGRKAVRLREAPITSVPEGKVGGIGDKTLESLSLIARLT
ncbi:hypothetical protein B0O99DRAFT_599669 [Bisporella sp. PMI_857]|nr:hypothetical protein B0O99DRAFT_599669 [Bisporella sp. PMI_857]